MQSDEQFYASGVDAFDEMFSAARKEVLRPPPKLSVSQWAARHGQLSRETSSTTGAFRAFAYQTGILDAFSDPKVLEVWCMKSARIGWTKCLDLVIGYFIHQSPSPTLLVQPRDTDAEDYSKTELMPMIRDTPVLSDLLGDPKAKDSGNTITKKTFRNGASVTMIGANSPGGFRRITMRQVLFDETDGYPVAGAGNEGDQIALGVKRTETFWDRKIGAGSTPTLKDFSRIEKGYDEGDQRKYYVPCPHCGEFQVLEWGGPDKPFGFKWSRDADGNGIPSSVVYQCRHNACVIQETDKKWMVDRGEWRAAKPFKGKASFHIWAAYSLFPNACWPNLVSEWLAAKSDPLRRQTFFNTVLGLPYEDFGEGSLRTEDIETRGEDWGDQVPNEVEVVTCGVDVQDFRVELEVVAWGPDEESWSVSYYVIDGRFSDAVTQRALDQFLQKRIEREDGRKLPISCTCIDSGGHHTQAVYDFSKSRLARKIFAIKGGSEPGGKRNPVWPTARPVHRKKKAFRPVILGTNAAKDVIRTRLFRDAPGPGYMHFPLGRSPNYYAQLVSERLVAKVQNGFRFRVWELPPGRANEALDVRVYAYAALCGLKQFGVKISSRKDVKPETTLPETVVTHQTEEAPGSILSKVVEMKPTPKPVEAKPPVPALSVTVPAKKVADSEDVATRKLINRLVNRLA